MTIGTGCKNLCQNIRLLYAWDEHHMGVYEGPAGRMKEIRHRHTREPVSMSSAKACKVLLMLNTQADLSKLFCCH